MFHSYFNEYAFDDINIYLLTSFVLSIGVNFGLTYPYIFALTFQCQLANCSPQVLRFIDAWKSLSIIFPHAHL